MHSAFMSSAGSVVFEWPMAVPAVERGDSRVDPQVTLQVMALSEALFAETAGEQVGHCAYNGSTQITPTTTYIISPSKT